MGAITLNDGLGMINAAFSGQLGPSTVSQLLGLIGDQDSAPGIDGVLNLIGLLNPVSDLASGEAIVEPLVDITITAHDITPAPEMCPR
jgi:hypothetical protein